MKKIYYCKHSLFVYMCPCICLFIPFMLHITLQADFYTIKRIAVYMYMIFEILGVYIFFIKSFGVVLQEGKLNLNVFKFPIREIPISGISKIEKAKKVMINMFALSGEQISITYGDNRQVNVSLIKNEEFINTIKDRIENQAQYTNNKVIDNGKLMEFFRISLAFIYLIVNGILTLDIVGEWIYYPVAITSFVVVNIICLYIYVKSFR